MSTILRSSRALPQALFPVSRCPLPPLATPALALRHQFHTLSSNPASAAPSPSILPSSSTSPITPPSSSRASSHSGECTHPLACVPTSSLYRALLLHTVTSSPILLKAGMAVINSQVNTINSAYNKPLKWAVDNTFYAQFCGGATPPEIRRTISNLRSLGFAGVILAYAREVETGDLANPDSIETQIAQWLDGTLKTIAYTDPGDFVAIKYTGAGLSVLPLLRERKKCFEHKTLGEAMVEICEAAKKSGVKLLMDAEQQSVQAGIHGWSKELMSRFNRDGEAVIYNTYQMYLKDSPRILSEHLACARKNGWRLGVKLVRGAYLNTDPRHLIHDTKANTDNAYDAAVRFLLTGGKSTSEPGDEFFTPFLKDLPEPKNEVEAKVDLVLASHCKPSVRKARELRKRLMESKEGCHVSCMSYAQLMGMADELSLSLVQPGASVSGASNGQLGNGENKIRRGEIEDRVYKYAVWGTTQECLKYLMRRAEENKDAMGRSMENRQAVWDELKRRSFLGSGEALA